MKTCWNCKKEVNQTALYCMSCGCMLEKEELIKKDGEENSIKDDKERTFSLITFLFGVSGFWPFIIVGSIVGIILYIFKPSYENDRYQKRARLGLALSIGSLLFYIASFILLIVVIVAA